MCGVTGFWQPEPGTHEALKAIARKMAQALFHRGPDDSGEWADASVGIAFGHRRLSIVDLSPEGHQPMMSASGRYVIVFNGEIYNHRDLRNGLELEGAAPAWRGHSDTEVMLAAFEQWGVARALPRLVGMFSFALWDTRERILHLARDRMGEKPLYYGFAGGTLLFGSELKALRAHPAFTAQLDLDALALFMRYACIPAPYSIYAGISKLLPGTLLSLDQSDLLARRYPTAHSYWTLAGAAANGASNVMRTEVAELTHSLDRILRDAVASQMVADVPLGAFLSGGIDSTTVVALMQAQSTQPVRTFTIGFAESGYNEADHAKSVARHLGTAHTELYVSPQDALDVVPSLPGIYDEPFADSSQIPTFLVSRLARHHVSVSLSGDGGDELFGGYNRHRWGRALRRYTSWLPQSLCRAMGTGIMRVSPDDWDARLRRMAWALPAHYRFAAAGDKMHKLAGALTATTDETLYQHLVSFWPDGTSARNAGYPVPPGWIAYGTPSALRTLPDRMMYLDALGYLPDDILVKVDRAAMKVSLETRAPFLDHRVVEFAWRLPFNMKLREGQGKWLLRQVLYQYVPRELVERPKQGFSVPLDSWLRGPLRDWAESLLNEAQLKRDGLLDHVSIRQRWSQHLSGTRNWQHHLWIVLMFQDWLAHWRSTAS